MARGWESKSVEDQMEEARRSQADLQGPVESPEEKERRRKIESLRLERSRLTEQLDRARSNAHRRMIQQSLEAIEAEIDALSVT
jgi:ribosomal protein S10